MAANKKSSPVVTEMFLRRRTQLFPCFYLTILPQIN